jgi:CheY-like chemotaxis protein
VLADVAMPGKDLQGTEAIKSDRLRHVPVLLLSAPSSGSTGTARRRRRRRCITKPFSPGAGGSREPAFAAEAARPVGGGSDTVLVAEQPSASGAAFGFSTRSRRDRPAELAAPTPIHVEGTPNFNAAPIELKPPPTTTSRRPSRSRVSTRTSIRPLHGSRDDALRRGAAAECGQRAESSFERQPQRCAYQRLRRDCSAATMR